jgi:hypothetical protein
MRRVRLGRVLGWRVAVAAATLAALSPAAALAAQAPTLARDPAFAPPVGVAAVDVAHGPMAADEAARAVAVSGSRIYTVGQAYADAVRGMDMAVVAQGPDGSLDPAFGDGGIELVANSGDDAATSVVVLPDGRLRVGGTAGGKAVIVGLDPDGRPDTAFGRVTIGSGTTAVEAMSLGSDGRLAVAGDAPSGAFVSVRDAASGGALTPVGSIPQASAVDVAMRPDGSPAVLLQRDGGARPQAVLAAFTAAGDRESGFGGSGTVALAPAASATAGGLVAAGTRLWATGGVGDGAAKSAFLARVEDDGSALELRRFQLAPGAPSAARGIDVTDGAAPAIVVSGAGGAGTPVWGAAAFQGLDGPLGSALMTTVAVPGDGAQSPDPALDAGDGFVALAGTLTSASGGVDARFGVAKLLVDRSCNLALSIATPSQVVLQDGGSAALSLGVVNLGWKACAGVVSVPAPYSLSRAGISGALPTGVVAPGASAVLDARLTRGGDPRPKDVLPVTVSAPGDVDPSDDTASVPVRMRYCDVELRAQRIPVLPDEGSRSVVVSVRNLGTTACRATEVTVGRGGRRSDPADPFTVRGGGSAAYGIDVRRYGGRPGRRLRIRLAVETSSRDARAANDTRTRRPRLVAVGDTAIRTASARMVSGVATRGHGASAAQVRVRRVDVAVRRLGGAGCTWLQDRAGRLASRRADPGHACDTIHWVQAQGTRRWTLGLARALPRGRYAVRSRAVIGWGLRESDFGRRDGNLRALRIR